MKRTVTFKLLIHLIFLLAISGTVFIQIDQQIPDSTGIFATPVFVALAHTDGKFNPTGPFRDYSSGIVVRPGLGPSFDFSFLGRHFLTVCNRVFSVRHRINIVGFFLPAMILLFFFQFYQSSRTNSEGESEISIKPIYLGDIAA